MKKIMLITIIGFTVLCVFTVFYPIRICDATDGNTLYVSRIGLGNYSSIQDAIDNANIGDTIYVYSGTYYENIVVNKMINLIGNDKDNTTIDGGAIGNVIKITVDKVTLTGFTIQNSGKVFPDSGINVSSNYNVISENILKNNFYGFTLFQVSNNIISENNITNDDHCGIYMNGASNNIVTGNTIRNNSFNGVGIYYASNNNTIAENTLSHNNYCGINIRISYNNDITGNTFTYNKIGIHVPIDKYNNHISGNIFSNNNNDIEKESDMLIFETLIVIVIIIAVTVLILFWKQKKQDNIPVSKNANYSIDARGELCPIPLIMAKKKIAKMNKGDVLEIITTDIVVKENIERFCRKKYELIRIDEDGKLFKIYIKK